MDHSVVTLGLPGSAFGPSLATQLQRYEISCHTLSLDAPLEGESVSVGPDGVIWQGMNLTSSSAIVVERPVFPWPQPQRVRELTLSSDERATAVAREREGRALVVSALRATAELRPVINPPLAAHLAASPAMALDRLKEQGVPTQPWHLGTTAAGPANENTPVVDALGQDRWQSPSVPRVGQPALFFEPFPGELLEIMVVGGNALGGVRYENHQGWRRREHVSVIGSGELTRDAASQAVDAATALDLGIACVALTEVDSVWRVLLILAGPDLAQWDQYLDGGVASALAESLYSLTSNES